MTKNLRPRIKNSLSFLLILCSFSQCNRKTDPLLGLQKRIVLAKTDNDRQVILSQLENYYLDMFIPDSIKQNVKAEVTNLLYQFEENKTAKRAEIEGEKNVYILESKLKDIDDQTAELQKRLDGLQQKRAKINNEIGSQQVKINSATANFAKAREAAEQKLLEHKARMLSLLGIPGARKTK